MPINWLNEDDILNQVKDEYERGYNLVNPIRDVFRKDLKRYYNEKKKKNSDKVGDTTVYNVHSALLARMYVNNPKISFDTFEVAHQDTINNLNMAFKEDYEAQDMEVHKYQQLWDALFYWVWIIAKTWWDWMQKKNRWQVVDPRTFIPDPDWDYSNWDYSYVWFSKKCYLQDLETYWIDTDDILQWQTSVDWPTQIKRDDQEVANLAPTEKWKRWDDSSVEIYYHFTSIKWQKYQIITANANTLLVDIKELPSVYSWEKDKPYKTPFPFAFKYFKPVRNNPFGYRVIDLLRDVQDTKAIIANLRLDKSKAELYPMYLYNTRLIKNKTDLDFGFNKLIWANPLEWESLNNAITPIQKDFRADNSYLIDDSLDKQVQSSTSIGRLTEWSWPERRETATTNKLVQGNTDINLSLIEKSMSWWDKQFAELWFRWYLENFEAWDSKKVKFFTWYGLIPKTLKKKDFLTIEVISIYVITNTDKVEKEEKQRIAYWQIFPLLQTLQVPPSSINFAFRQLLLTSGIEPQQVEIMIPKTPQEIIAEENIDLLRAWEFVEVEENYDVFTHLTILKQAWTWLNIELYRQWLLDLYTIQGWDTAQLNEVSESVSNNVSAQAMAQMWNAWQNLLANEM